MNLVFIILITTLVWADLPVHCVYTQALGKWIFVLNTDSFTADIHSEETQCGHGQPDQVAELENPNHEFKYDSEEQVEIELFEPNIAKSDTYGDGTWTMIYDEGFVITFEDRSFFTYFMYTVGEKTNEWLSVCDKTMQGWSQPTDPKDHENWGCFYGYKDYVPTDGPQEIAQTETTDIRWVEPESTSLKSFLQMPPMYEDQTVLIETINRSQDSWTAGINQSFKGMTLAQVNSQVGRRKTKNPVTPELPNFTQVGSEKGTGAYENMDWSQLRKTDDVSLLAFLEVPVEDIPTDELPDAWDWTDIDGTSYVPPVRSQGNCGSCYAQSFLQMLSSRIRVKTLNQHKEDLSVQYIVSCGLYTEGCDGGFPTLVGKFITEFDIVPKTCFPESGNAECKDVCDTSELEYNYSVDDYFYIGGYYGASDEEQMMKELRARGPIIGNFEPPSDFSFYKNGIYEYADLSFRDETDEPNTTNMREDGMDWERVDHSVLIVGYGEENGKKFWRLQNSWGNNWGEDGFFKMRRGTDECSVESMGEAAIPTVVKN